MLTIPTKFVIDSARKLNLIFWQITEAGNELARQDEDITLEDSINLLEETINELKDSARAGDKIKISMQSANMAGGRKKGMQLRTFNIYLKEPETKQVQSIGNLSLLEENVKLKLEMQHDKEKQELLKRIEALEAPEPEQNNIEKSIEGITTILNHPITSLVVGWFANKSTQAPAPAINGIPSNDYNNLISRIEKIDPEFIKMLNAIVTAAEENKDTYFMYRNMLVK